MLFLIYKTINKINGKYYIGAHKTKNINDRYLGSGILLKKAITKYGRNNFHKEIVKECTSEIEMFQEEKRIVDECLKDKKCYNLNAGGKGGWNHYNSLGLNFGKNNIMHNKKYKKKNMQSNLKTRNKNPQKYINIANENLKKAVIENTGKKRPDHSIKMKKISKNIWKNNREKIRDALSSWFEVFPPDSNESIKTNRLKDFCKKHNLPYVSIWKTTIDNRKLTKGKAAGWYAKKL
jgi:hypothetical protein